MAALDTLSFLLQHSALVAVVAAVAAALVAASRDAAQPRQGDQQDGDHDDMQDDPQEAAEGVLHDTSYGGSNTNNKGENEEAPAARLRRHRAPSTLSPHSPPHSSKSRNPSTSTTTNASSLVTPTTKNLPLRPQTPPPNDTERPASPCNESPLPAPAAASQIRRVHAIVRNIDACAATTTTTKSMQMATTTTTSKEPLMKTTPSSASPSSPQPHKPCDNFHAPATPQIQSLATASIPPASTSVSVSNSEPQKPIISKSDKLSPSIHLSSTFSRQATTVAKNNSVSETSSSAQPPPPSLPAPSADAGPKIVNSVNTPTPNTISESHMNPKTKEMSIQPSQQQASPVASYSILGHGRSLEHEHALKRRHQGPNNTLPISNHHMKPDDRQVQPKQDLPDTVMAASVLSHQSLATNGSSHSPVRDGADRALYRATSSGAISHTSIGSTESSRDSTDDGNETTQYVGNAINKTDKNLARTPIGATDTYKSKMDANATTPTRSTTSKRLNDPIAVDISNASLIDATVSSTATITSELNNVDRFGQLHPLSTLAPLSSDNELSFTHDVLSNLSAESAGTGILAQVQAALGVSSSADTERPLQLDLFVSSPSDITLTDSVLSQTPSQDNLVSIEPPSSSFPPPTEQKHQHRHPQPPPRRESKDLFSQFATSAAVSPSQTTKRHNQLHPQLQRQQQPHKHQPTDVFMRAAYLASFPSPQLPTSTLTRLFLDDNNIMSIPSSAFTELTQLRVLSMSKNRLTTLPPGICHLRNLERLCLRQNALDSLPLEFSNLVHLRVCDLGENQLTRIDPCTFIRMPHLQTLILACNQLTTLPSSLGYRAGSLHTVYVFSNPFAIPFWYIVEPVVRSMPMSLPQVESLMEAPMRDVAPSVSVMDDSLHSSDGEMGYIAARDAFDKMRLPHGMVSRLAYPGHGYLLRLLGFLRDEFDIGMEFADVRFHVSQPAPAAQASTTVPLTRARPMSFSSVSTSSSMFGDHGSINSGVTLTNGSSSASMSGSYHADTHSTSIISSSTSSLSDGSFVYDGNAVTTSGLSSASSTATLRQTTHPLHMHLPNPISPVSLRMADKRNRIIAEIISTEKTYIDELTTLHDVYYRPLQQANILGRQDLDRVFSPVWMDIWVLHRDVVYPTLCRLVSMDPQCVGVAFSALCPAFAERYATYMNSFDVLTAFVSVLEAAATQSSLTRTGMMLPLGLNRVVSGSSSSASSVLMDSNTQFSMQSTLTTQLQSSHQLQQQHPSQSQLESISNVSCMIPPVSAIRRSAARQFVALLKSAKLDSRHTQINLNAYLVMPVQRLPRYKLLLDSLLNATPYDHADRMYVERAVDDMRATVEHCNEKKREWEKQVVAYRRVVEAMSRIRVKDTSIGSTLLSMSSMSMVDLAGTATTISPALQSTLSLLSDASAVTDASPSLPLMLPPPLRQPRLRALIRTSDGMDLRVVKYLEIATTSQPIDPAIVTHNKPSKSRHVVYNAMREYRFNVSRDEATGASTRAAREVESGGAIAVYGVPRTNGKRCTLFLFTDVLCWCTKARDGDVGDVELVKAFGVGFGRSVGNVRSSGSIPTHDVHSGVSLSTNSSPMLLPPRSSSLSTSSASASPALSTPSLRAELLPVILGDHRSTDSRESVLRVCDGVGVLYIRGPTSDLVGWVASIHAMSAM